MKITGFTSLLEASYGKLPVTSSSLLNGIRIKYEDNWYLVGQACRNLSRNPHRLVNASPEEPDYQVLFLAALLLSTNNSSDRIDLTLGFPYSTYNIYRPVLERFLAKKNFVIEYDTSTYKKDGIIEKKLIEIGNFEVVPELAACVIGLKKHYKVPEENFMVISLGFGTIEIGVVSDEGLNKRTVISIPGIVRCIKNLRDELEKENIIGFMTDHQLDDAFVKGSVILNRNLINLKKIKSSILKSFYKEYISDTIRTMISDRDFERIEKIYICGGGTHYEELQESFKHEFDRIVSVEFVKEPDVLAATGYYFNSLRISNGQSSLPVGIDLGNSITYVCTNDYDR
jgi:hypothetical protein